MTSQAIADTTVDDPARDQSTDSGGLDPRCVGPECAGEAAPVETLSALASEDRLAILDAVVRARDRGETPVSFSELRETVSISDSGRFAYHLRTLDGRVLTRSADGYSFHEDCCGFLIEAIASIEP